MKDAVLTIRLPRATRRKIEKLAKAEGRSLSAQVERLIEAGLQSGGAAEPMATYRREPKGLAGVLAGGRVPRLSDFRAVRRDLSDSLARRDESRRR